MNRLDFLKTMALLPLSCHNMPLQDLAKVSASLPNSDKMPVLFVGHGSPMNAIEDNPFTKSLKAWGTMLQKQQKPSAILVVSAHWLTQGSFVNVSPKPKTIHDFGGFPQPLFDTQYPAPGAPEVAKSAAELSAFLHETDDWGLDHGAWTILVHLFPDADIPVFQLSIDYYKPMQYHLDLAASLQALRKKGVLIIGSGNIVHNLRLSMPSFQASDPKPFDWAVEFDQWINQKLNERDFQSIVQFEKAGAAAKLSVPTTDHYIPLLYSIGLSDTKDQISTIFEEVTFGGISMRTFAMTNGS